MTALPRSSKGTYLIEGTKYPSVTTIIGVLDKPALMYWAAKAVAEAAVFLPDEWIPIARRDQQAAVDHLKSSPWRDRDRGANLGSALHKAIECETLGLPMPTMDEPCTQMLDQYQRWAAKFRPTWELSEATVWSPSGGYAGTTDGVVVIGGKRYIVDLKTTKPGRQGHGIYPEVALQLAAYRYAEWIILPDGSKLPMPQVDGALAIWVRPDTCRALHVTADERAFSAFRSVLAAAVDWTWADDVAWVGNDLSEPVREEVS